MNEEDRKKLIAGMEAMHQLEAKLDAIDHKNNPEALEEEADIMDQMLFVSMAMGPLRRKMATGGAATDAASDGATSDDNAPTKNDLEGLSGTQTGEHA
jgi:hypothetical protein